MLKRWLNRGDIDGFFGLFIDNLLQLMLIYGLCTSPFLCNIPAKFVTATILPGAAISILAGNLFYSWQAWQLMKRTGCEDVTALPYGINTPSLIAYITLIMTPVYQGAVAAGKTPDEAWKLAWQAGLFACLGSGVLELLGAFVGDWIRRVTPRPAMLSALAGIAITFIAMNFIFQLFASPMIAVLPMLLVLFTYAGRLKLPLGLPGGLIALVLGVALAWGFHAAGVAFWSPPKGDVSLQICLPHFVGGDVFALFNSELGWKFLAIIVPMGLINVVASLQNLDSAEAAGDRFETKPSLIANGAGSVLAAFFGSPFPTTIYIGHPGWKAMGAKASYSVLNGAVISLVCLLGAMSVILAVVPMEAALGILLWIGMVITAQAFSEVPPRHAIAVAVGLIPAIAAWAILLIDQTAQSAGKTLLEVVGPLADRGLFVRGAAALNQGFLFSSMILAAATAMVVDRRFRAAGIWMAAAAVLAATGLIHGYEITSVGIENRFLEFQFGPEAKNPALMFAIIYALTAAGLFVLDRHEAKSDSSPS